jgi:class I fructose-bisphosphate aldolase
MNITPVVQSILKNYESESEAVRAQLARLLMAGRLGGTGKMIILPVDQGFEHGPARSFAMNQAAYDPHYHFQLAIDAGLNAYAAPLGMLEAGHVTFKDQIPTILKVNSANSLSRVTEAPDQAVTASVKDAVRLNCIAIGFTIYPGSDAMYQQYEEFRAVAEEARANDLAVVLWSYPRGGSLSKDGELALDVVGYGAHMAALLGAHVIKVKLPTAHLEQPENKKIYEGQNIPRATLTERVRHIVQCAFNGRRIVVFSGGAAKGDQNLHEEARAILGGGGNGSIIGRNSFQRSRAEALKLLDELTGIYLGKT